jgi:hypothetical protein
VAGLEQAVVVPDVAGRRHAHATHQRRGLVGENVAEHVLGNDHVERPGLSNQVERGRIDVVVIRYDVGKPCRALVENLAEERHRAEHVRLVDAGDASRVTAPLAALGEAEREVVHALAAPTCDDHRVTRFAIVDHFTAAARREQTLGRFADDDEVDLPRAWVGERQRNAWYGARGTHPCVELELDAEVELRRDLGAVGIADRRPAHCAEQDCFGASRSRKRRRRQRVTGRLVVLRAPGIFAEPEAEWRVARNLLEQWQRRGDDFGADAVAGQHDDIEDAFLGHCRNA